MSWRLPVRAVEKPWGRDRLPPPFIAPGGKRIGEIWFEPPTELSQLLVKYIFTSERLSVQVHPDDAQARAAGHANRGGGGGKEECWLIVDAEPGAKLAIGFTERIGPERMRTAALDGSIIDLLAWHPVAAGDFFYIPANTVHAIGAGISLIEVQQNADITYRLFDYGRPRELHLDEGIDVADGGPHPPSLRFQVPDRGTIALADGPYFVLHRLDGAPDAALLAACDGPLLVIPQTGEVLLGDEALHPGECGHVASLSAADFTAAGQCLIARPKGKRRAR